MTTDTAQTAPRDEMAEQLIAHGLISNAHYLSCNNVLSVPRGFALAAPWNLPSRLFQFPIEVGSPAKDQPRRLGLMHILLEDHPFVQHVQATLGIELDPFGAPNEFGFSHRRTGSWWHAVDLVSAGRWRDLLATIEFTTDHDIANAVAFGLDYSGHHDSKAAGHITTAEARQMMAAIDAAEPSDRAAILAALSAPSLCRQDKGQESWPINGARDSTAEARAWSRIIGIEEGWFKHDRAGFLGWTETGRDRYTAGDQPTFVEASGQSAFAF